MRVFFGEWACNFRFVLLGCFSMSHEPGGAHLFIIVWIPLIYTVAYTFLYIKNPPSENFPLLASVCAVFVCSDPSIIQSLQTVYCCSEKSSVVWGSRVVPLLEGSGQHSDWYKKTISWFDFAWLFQMLCGLIGCFIICLSKLTDCGHNCWLWFLIFIWH